MSNIIIDADLLDEVEDVESNGDLFEISTLNPSVAGQVRELSTLWNGDITMTEEGLLDDPELDLALSTVKFSRKLLKDDPQETATDPRLTVNLKERLRANQDVHRLVVAPPAPPAPYVETVVEPRWSPTLKDRLGRISGLVDLKGKDLFEAGSDVGQHMPPTESRLSLVQNAEGWETPIDFSADDITF